MSVSAIESAEWRVLESCVANLGCSRAAPKSTKSVLSGAYRLAFIDSFYHKQHYVHLLRFYRPRRCPCHRWAEETCCPWDRPSPRAPATDNPSASKQLWPEVRQSACLPYKHPGSTSAPSHTCSRSHPSFLDRGSQQLYREYSAYDGKPGLFTLAELHVLHVQLHVDPQKAAAACAS